MEKFETLPHNHVRCRMCGTVFYNDRIYDLQLKCPNEGCVNNIHGIGNSNWGR